MVSHEKQAALAAVATRRPGPPKSVNITPEWLRPIGVVEYTGIGRTTIYSYISSGELPSRLVRGVRLIRRADVDKFLEGFEIAKS